MITFLLLHDRRRIPPRKLMGIAKRYFAEDPSREFLFEQAKSISLLQSPPSWGLAATSPADWVLTQRMRESRGMKSTNRRLRRNRSRSRTRSDQEASTPDENDIEEIAKYLDEMQRTLAVIATGYGPGDDDEERRRKRRKMLMWGAVAVAFVAVSYAVVTQYGPAAVPAIDSDSTGKDSSGRIERDLLETRRHQNKTVPRVETARQQPTIGSSRESQKLNAPSQQMSGAQSRREKDSGRQGTVEFEVNPKGFVDSVPVAKEVKTSEQMTHSSASRNPTKATFGSSTIRAPSSSRAEKVDVAAKYSTSGDTGASDQDASGPGRYVKGILNGIDKMPGSRWVKGVYQDIRRAVVDLEPDFILHGVSLLPEFLSKRFSQARQAILGGEGAHFVRETIHETRGKGKHLVRDAVVRLQRFIAKRLRRFFADDGRGSRLLKSARRALNENEAEIVAL